MNQGGLLFLRQAKGIQLNLSQDNARFSKSFIGVNRTGTQTAKSITRGSAIRGIVLYFKPQIIGGLFLPSFSNKRANKYKVPLFLPNVPLLLPDCVDRGRSSLAVPFTNQIALLKKDRYRVLRNVVGYRASLKSERRTHKRSVGRKYLERYAPGIKSGI